VREDQLAGRWRPEWPDVPAEFLLALVNADAAQTI